MDALGNETQQILSIPSQKWALKFNSTATAVAFGKAPEADSGQNVLEIPYNWKIARMTQDASETHYALFDDDAAWTGALSALSGKVDASSLPLSVSLGGTGGASVSGAFLVKTTTVSGSSISAGATYNISQAVSPESGYDPLCVCGWGSSGMTYLSIANCYLDSSGTLHMSGRNLGSSSVTPSFSVHVLYARAT